MVGGGEEGGGAQCEGGTVKVKRDGEGKEGCHGAKLGKGQVWVVG